jgi:integrase
VTVHHGRHTFVSLSLARLVPIAAVRDAAGHASISTTNIYTHSLDAVPVRSLLAS